MTQHKQKVWRVTDHVTPSLPASDRMIRSARRFETRSAKRQMTELATNQTKTSHQFGLDDRHRYRTVARYEPPINVHPAMLYRRHDQSAGASSSVSGFGCQVTGLFNGVYCVRASHG